MAALTSEAQRMLAEVARLARDGKVLTHEQIRARTEPEQLAMSELQQERCAQSADGGWRVTLEGLWQLTALGDKDALAEIEVAERVAAEIRRRIEADPEALLTLGQVAGSVGVEVSAAHRALLRIALRRDAKLFAEGTDPLEPISAARLKFTPAFLAHEWMPFERGAGARRVRVEIENLRALTRARLELPLTPGLSLLTGPSGSGKSTLVRALSFLRDSLERGPVAATRWLGGRSELRSIGSDRNPRVTLAVGRTAWTLEARADDGLVDPAFGERLTVGREAWVEGAAGASHLQVFGERVSQIKTPALARLLLNSPSYRELIVLGEMLMQQVTYPAFSTGDIRDDPTSFPPDDDVLHSSGRNLLFVLARWAQRNRWYGKQRAWVMHVMEEAFPMFDGLESELQGETARGWFFRKESDRRMSFNSLSDGEIAALAVLTAVAGARANAMLCIDEIENHLHPHALRTLVRAVRARAQSEGFHVLAVTHSPVVLDELNGAPERVFVMERGQEWPPTELSAIHDPDWLANFSLGALYGKEFGEQQDLPADEGDARSADHNR